jgi:hypothetical protein
VRLCICAKNMRANNILPSSQQPNAAMPIRICVLRGYIYVAMYLGSNV